MTIDPSKDYRATVKTTMGTIEIKLLPKESPIAVNNFVFLAREGFYDNDKFNRVMKFFMIQAGDPAGTGGAGYTIPDDPVKREYEPGFVMMTKPNQENTKPNTASSQFWIAHDQNLHLLTDEAIIGEVVKGYSVVDDIAYVPVDQTDTGEPSIPQEPVYIDSVTITER